MKFTEKLEAYFNSGSTEKQNKKRLGGLLIGITALLLAISMIVLLVASIVLAVGNDNKGDNSDIDSEPTVNNDLIVTTDVADITSMKDMGEFLDINTVFEGAIPKTDIKNFGNIYRPTVADVDGSDDNTTLYVGTATYSIYVRSVAREAFDEMVKEFYKETGLTTLWVKLAYFYEDGKETENPALYSNALTIKLEYANADRSASNGSIAGVEDYEWIYDHAHEFGFVQVTDTEGQENVFRYVGAAHAQYMEKQIKGNSFYGISEHLAALKSKGTNKINLGKIKVDGKSVNYYAYYLPVDGIAADGSVETNEDGTASASAQYLIPDPEKFEYSVSSNGVDGYIITYWAKATIK